MHIVEERFLERIRRENALSLSPPLIIDESRLVLSSADYVELFKSQITSRLLDYQARKLKDQNQGYYTIGSAGHEGNVALAKFLQSNDPCFLHYRSGALMVEHLKKDVGLEVVDSILLSLCAVASDPVSGGRHKVWGNRNLSIPPQTSTIASHLPKAVGAAIALEKMRRFKNSHTSFENSIVVCSFGDASLNHSTAQGAINSALWASYQKLPVPILFLCEDNSIGISVKTPQLWVEKSMKSRDGLAYFQANGLNLIDATHVTKQAVDFCRTSRKPTFLHLKTVRLLGHAGSDVESEYLSKEEIEVQESKDPLLASADIVVQNKWMSSSEILDFYEKQKAWIESRSHSIIEKPKLETYEAVSSVIAPHDVQSIKIEARRGNSDVSLVPMGGKPRHMAMLINAGLSDLMKKYPEMLIFGEDVAKKGGVYHVTAGLHDVFGPARVFNTILDEQTILGMAIGAGHLGFLPVPEIQYLAYYHNAEDQIRGEAASMQFFSGGQFKNPMMIRMASFAYQKGFGGHFHNDNSIGAIRDVPGVVMAAPSRGDDAVGMMRTLMAMAKVNGRVSFFLEPIALYMTKDLYEEGDARWSCHYPPADHAIALGEVGVYGAEAKDLLVISYANGLYFSLRAAKKMEAMGYQAKVIDLRWLNPLPLDALLKETQGFKKILIVDECRQTGGGVVDSVKSFLYDHLDPKPQISSLSSKDSYIPLGTAANLVLLSEADIFNQMISMMKG